MATSTSPNINVQFTTAGTKTGILRVTANGVTTEKSVSVVVKPEPPVLVAYEQGYGWYGGAVTGGAGGSVVNVYTYEQLRTALKTVAPLIIIVHGIINGTGVTDIGFSCESNKTILGAPKSVINGMNLSWFSKTNVLIRNLKFTGMPDLLAAGKQKIDYLTFLGTTRVCVNHCEGVGSVGTDSLFDFCDGSDYITVSDNIYRSDDKGSLVGARDVEPKDTGKLRISFIRNRFIDIFERSPSYRIGAGCHVLNNLYESVASTNTTGYAVGSRVGAVVAVEANDFSEYKGHALQCMDADANTSDGSPIPYGRFNGISSNIFGSGTNVLKGTTETAFTIPYDTSGYKLAVGDVKVSVRANAGATLTLAQMGY